MLGLYKQSVFRDRQQQGRAIAPALPRIHAIHGNNVAAEPPWMGSRRVSENTLLIQAGLLAQFYRHGTADTVLPTQFCRNSFIDSFS